MNPLTPRQKQCLDFIRAYKDANGIMPSFRDILVGIRCSSSSHVAHLVRKLEESGHIRCSSKRARSIELLTPDSMRAVLLSPEVFRLVQAYAASERISVDTATNELLRGALGAA